MGKNEASPQTWNSRPALSFASRNAWPETSSELFGLISLAIRRGRRQKVQRENTEAGEHDGAPPLGHGEGSIHMVPDSRDHERGTPRPRTQRYQPDYSRLLGLHCDFVNMHRAMEFGLEEACLLEFCQLGKS